MKTRFFLLLFTLCAASCTKVERFNTYDMNVGDTIAHDKNLSVILEKVIDSRCPTEVFCVWEGMVEAEFVLDFDEVSDLLLTLSDKFPDTVLMGYKFTLIEVSPFPVDELPIPQEDYTVRLLIE